MGIKQHGDNGMDYFAFTAGFEIVYHSQGLAKSTSHRGMTTNGILQCWNKKILPHLNRMMKTYFSKLLNMGTGAKQNGMCSFFENFFP